LTTLLFKDKDLLIYPNPTDNYLNIIIEEAVSNSSIQVFNMNGKILLSKELNESTIRIDVSNLTNGLCYVRQLGDAGNIIMKSKFVKI